MRWASISLKLKNKKSNKKFIEDDAKHLNELLVRQVFDVSSSSNHTIHASFIYIEYHVQSRYLFSFYISQDAIHHLNYYISAKFIQNVPYRISNFVK